MFGTWHTVSAQNEPNDRSYVFHGERLLALHFVGDEMSQYCIMFTISIKEGMVNGDYCTRTNLFCKACLFVRRIETQVNMTLEGG